MTTSAGSKQPQQDVVSRSHSKSRVVFVVYHSQKCAAVVPVTGGVIQEEGNGDATTDNWDGEVLTASCLELDG